MVVFGALAIATQCSKKTLALHDYAALLLLRRVAKGVNMQGKKTLAPSPVRLPEDLKQWLKHKAIDNFRSMNSEIIARLEQSRKAEEAQHEKQA